MQSNELSSIKRYQREFFATFGRRLEIDWEAMNGVKSAPIEDFNYFTEEGKMLTAAKILDSCIKKHDADINKITNREKRLKSSDYVKERAAIVEFSKLVMHHKLNKINAAKLINRDRTMFYTYAKKNL